MRPIEYYIEQFSALRVDNVKTRYTAATMFKAPHKPLLLLSVIDLAAAGLFDNNTLTINDDLTEAFRAYWRAILPGTKGSIILPFFHMSRQSFWHLLPKAGKEREAAVVHQVRSWTQFDSIYNGAQLDNDLFLYIHEPSARAVLRSTLFTSFFSPDAVQRLQHRSDITTEAWRYSSYLLHAVAGNVADALPIGQYKVRPAARQQGFRRCVIHGYDNRCALCGIRVRTPEGYSVSDAAHIIPWRISRNDSPVNGLALCKLCHWLFDAGLLGITSSYSIMLSPQMLGEVNSLGHLAALAGRSIALPVSQDIYPSQSALAWHRKETFRSRAE